MRLHIILAFTFLCICGSLSAQQNYLLEIQSLKDSALLQTISYRKAFRSKIECDKELQNVLSICYNNGYLTAAYDSVISDSLKLKRDLTAFDDSTKTDTLKLKAYLNFGSWNYLLEIQSLNDSLLLKKIPYKKTFGSKTECDKELQKVLFTFHRKGYLSASYDSVISDSLKTKAYLNFGLKSVSLQRDYLLEIQSLNDSLLLKKIPYKKTFSSKTECEKELQNVLFTCYNNAYITATYDSVISDSLKTKAYLNFGSQYKWAHLKNGNVDEGVLSIIGFREKLYSNRPINYKDVRRIQERLITYFENNGFPFASVKLDSIVIADGSISAQLKLTKNEEEKIDSIQIKGTAKISPIYIYSYLGIKPGSLYNESQLQQVNARIKELPFLRSTQPATVKFTKKFNKLVLYLNKKNADQFDGIIGLMPNSQTGKVLFTGNLHLKLQNGLGRGELIELSWDRLQTQTQDLIAHLVYPFVLHSPFGLDYSFKLYKRDTTYLQVTQSIGLQHLLIGGNYVKIFYTSKISTLLSTAGLDSVSTLPTYADVYTNMFGVGLKYEKLDYRLNPRKGYSIVFDASAGEKTIKKNVNVNPVAYENVQLNSTQYTGSFVGSVFIPMTPRSTFKIGMQSAFLFGPDLFQDELFRIGGLNTLRGFDVESIYASAYSILTLEYRYILETNSYLYLFSDNAYYQNSSVGLPFGTPTHDTPIGFGMGISFETKAGIFSINYALGKQLGNPIQFGDGKINFGIVNYF